MTKKGVLKIAGIIVGPLLVMAVAAYFLYPYLNEQEYEEISDKYERRDAPVSQVEGMRIGKDFQTLVEQVKLLKNVNDELNKQVDSLQAKNEELHLQLKEGVKEEETEGQSELDQANTDSLKTTTVSQNSIHEKKLSERVKSLLDLDNEDLKPIVNEMTDAQLVRLYQSGGGIQRKKLLRSLEPKRAAKLMTKVML